MFVFFQKIWYVYRGNDFENVENIFVYKEQPHETAENMDVRSGWRHALRHRQGTVEGSAKGSGGRNRHRAAAGEAERHGRAEGGIPQKQEVRKVLHAAE